MKALNTVKAGESATVFKVVGNSPLKRRIMDMGITRGCSVFVRKTAPLGDPIEIKLRGYSLTIRKSEAKNILIY